MATMFDDVDARCPYFKGSGERKVMCEGITDDCNTILDFRNRESRNKHRELFCDRKYENCEIYRALEEKYDD
jgi:hypothetical protein